MSQRSTNSKPLSFFLANIPITLSMSIFALLLICNNAKALNRVCPIDAFKLVCRRFNTLPDRSHLHEVPGTEAQILSNTLRFGYMSWSQTFRDETMVDGQSFFDTDSHLLFHRKNSSFVLTGIGRSS